MSTTSLNLNIEPVEPPELEENFWVRLEQHDTRDNLVTLGDAAAAIDALFDLQPCEDGLGNGGQASKMDADAKPADKPEEDEFYQEMKERLDPAICDEGGKTWTAWVNVLRSHQDPGYVLRSESAKVIQTMLVREQKSEMVLLSGASTYDLKWPYGGRLSVSGASAREVLGSTVNFEKAVDGHVTISYESSYERVLVEMPLPPVRAKTTDYDAAAANAALAVFWLDFADVCELTPPADDPSSSHASKERLCGKGKNIDLVDLSPVRCWQTLRHYTRCSCARDLADTWDEEQETSCPEGLQPGWHYLGVKDVFEGYVDCAKDIGDVADPAYYERKCCWPVPAGKSLPRCWESRALWRSGGVEIEGGAQKHIDAYGPDVRLIAVAPPDGICGDIITEYRYRFKSCCDGVPEMSIDPDVAPEVMADNSEAYLQILGGMGPYTVSTASDGLYINDIGRKSLQTMGTMIRLRSTQMCGMLSVTITDACNQTATHAMRATNGQWARDNAPPSRCAGPPWSEPEQVGWYMFVASGGRGLSFSRNQPSTSSWCSPRIPNPLSACEQWCAGIVGPGAEQDNCRIYPLVSLYDDAGCAPGTATICQCNGIFVQQHNKWVC